MNEPRTSLASGQTRLVNSVAKSLIVVYMMLLLIWSAGCYKMISTAFLENELLRIHVDHSGSINDFIQFYTAAIVGERCFSSHDSLYDSSLQLAVVNDVIQPAKLETGFILQYPPLFFALLAPLAHFSIGGSWLVWNGINLAILITTIAILARTCTLKYKLCLGVAAIASEPFIMTFFLGQSSICLMLAQLCFWLLLRERQYMWAGALTVLAIFKVQYLPILLLAGFVLGKWNFIRGLFAGGLAYVVFSSLLYGPNCVIDYPLKLLKGEYSGFIPFNVMQNIRGQLIHVGMSEQMATNLSAVCFLVALLTTFLIWTVVYRKLKQSETCAFEICASMSILLMLATSLHTFTYDYVLNLIAFHWMLQATKGRSLSTGMLVMRSSIFVYPIISAIDFLMRFHIVHSFALLNLVFVGITASYVYTLCKSGDSLLLGNLLIRAGVISRRDLETALAIAKQQHRLLGECLVQEGVISLNVLDQALTLQNKLRANSLSTR